MKHMYFLMLATALVGCSTNATLTVDSYPKGATIKEQGGSNFIQRAPAVANYPKSLLINHKDGKGCYLVKGFNATWPSGVSASTPNPLKMCGSPTGSYTYLIKRPDIEEGYQDDILFGLEVERMLNQRNAHKDAVNGMLINSFGNSLIQAQNARNQSQQLYIESQKQQLTTPTKVNCLSQSYGDTGLVNCSIR